MRIATVAIALLVACSAAQSQKVVAPAQHQGGEEVVIDDQIVEAALACEPSKQQKYTACPGNKFVRLTWSAGKDESRARARSRKHKTFTRPNGDRVRVLSQSDVDRELKSKQSIVHLDVHIRKTSLHTHKVMISGGATDHDPTEGTLALCGVSTFTIIERDAKWTCEDNSEGTN